MQFLKDNKLIIIVLILGIIFFGYKYIFNIDVDTKIVVTDPSSLFTQNALDTEFTEYLFKIKQIQVDDSLFQSNIWATLKDFSIVVPETVPGKSDLFGPDGNDLNLNKSVSPKTKKP